MLYLNTLVLNLGAITFLWNIVAIAIKMSKFRKTSLPAPYIRKLNDSVCSLKYLNQHAIISYVVCDPGLSS
jgi:hypothetical protein